MDATPRRIRPGSALRSAFAEVVGEVAAVIQGKDEIIEQAVVALLARGHVLLEDLPGVGKSTLARCLAAAVGGKLSRIQFTSDLLPADILGVNVWRPSTEGFEFRPGPVFANVVLADEINRAPPRTQSALLEGMGEATVSIDGVSHALPRPFIVLATQNPLEHHGTYPLPESQRDRFMLRLALGYASADVEAALLETAPSVDGPAVRTVVSADEVTRAQAEAAQVFVHPDLARYAQRVVGATREHPEVRLGVSTRGALAWLAAARARAWLAEREHVSIDDLQELAAVALAHRLVVAGRGSQAEGGAHAAAADLVRELVATVPVPT